MPSHRNYDRALKELKSLEDAAPTEDAQPPQSPAPPPEPPVTTPPEPAQIQSNQQPIPQIGFVPQSSEIAPQPTPAETEKLTPRDNWQPAVPARCATNDPRPPAR